MYFPLVETASDGLCVLVGGVLHQNIFLDVASPFSSFLDALILLPSADHCQDLILCKLMCQILMVAVSASPTQNSSDLAELLHQVGTMLPGESILVGEVCW